MDCDANTLRVAGIVSDSVVDGPGLRLSLYVQGCPHKCKGCHNANTWDFDGGTEMTVAEITAQIVNNPLLDGVTLTGGEPFCHAAPLIEIAGFARSRGLNVWVWSGWTYEELLENPAPRALELLALCDVLVDGRFEMEARTLALEWRGSANQRVIDVQKSRDCGKVTLYEPTTYGGAFDVPKWG